MFRLEFADFQPVVRFVFSYNGQGNWKRVSISSGGHHHGHCEVIATGHLLQHIRRKSFGMCRWINCLRCLSFIQSFPVA